VVLPTPPFWLAMAMMRAMRRVIPSLIRDRADTGLPIMP
jgi:hypothetical protein